MLQDKYQIDYYHPTENGIIIHEEFKVEMHSISLYYVIITDEFRYGLNTKRIGSESI